MTYRAPTKSERREMSVRRNLAAELSDDAELCPKCGRRFVLPDTRAGRMGICRTCWYNALTAATEAAEAEEAARRKYDTARQRKRRAKLKAEKIEQERKCETMTDQGKSGNEVAVRRTIANFEIGPVPGLPSEECPWCGAATEFVQTVVHGDEAADCHHCPECGFFIVSQGA